MARVAQQTSIAIIVIVQLLHIPQGFGAPLEQLAEGAQVASGVTNDDDSRHHRSRTDSWTRLESSQEHQNDEIPEFTSNYNTRRTSSTYAPRTLNSSQVRNRNVQGDVSGKGSPGHQPEWWNGIRKWLGLRLEQSLGSAESKIAEGDARNKQQTSLVKTQDSLPGISDAHSEGEEDEGQEKWHETTIHPTGSAVSRNIIHNVRHNKQMYKIEDPHGLRTHHLENNSESDVDIMENMHQRGNLNSVWNEKLDFGDSEISDTANHHNALESLQRGRVEPSESDKEEEDLSDVETQQMVRTFLRLFRAIDRHIDNSLSTKKRTLHFKLKPRIRHHQLTQSNPITDGDEHLGHRTKHSLLSGNDDEDPSAQDVASADADQDRGTRGDGHGRSVGSFVAGIMRKSPRSPPAKQGEVIAMGADSTATVRRHVELDDEMEDSMIEQIGIPRSAPSFTARKKLLHSKDSAAGGIWSHLLNRAVLLFERKPGSIGATSKSV
jgi:hypothetical protein